MPLSGLLDGEFFNHYIKTGRYFSSVILFRLLLFSLSLEDWIVFFLHYIVDQFSDFIPFKATS